MLLWFFLTKEEIVLEKIPLAKVSSISTESKKELAIKNSDTVYPVNKKQIDKNLSKDLIQEILKEEEKVLKAYIEESLDSKDERIRLQMIEEQEILLSEYGFE